MSCGFKFLISLTADIQGRIQDFKLGGGGRTYKKSHRAEGGEKTLGVFRVKNHDFMQIKIIFFPTLGGWVRPPLNPPLLLYLLAYKLVLLITFLFSKLNFNNLISQDSFCCFFCQSSIQI